MSGKKKHTTSWGNVSEWYGTYLEKEDTYQNKVILPNLLRLLSIKKGTRVLDLACGQGFFTKPIAKLGADVVGVDLAPEFITQARAAHPNSTFYVAPASELSFARNGEFDVVICILALQNMEDIFSVFREVKRVLKPNGRFLFVLNHPAFRVLKRSEWGWDEEKKNQYRRVDGYLSPAKVFIDMHPGAKNKKQTISYHRSLQDFFKALAGAGLTVLHLEEWISHRMSEKGPRQKAEDIARKEIPLFMALEACPLGAVTLN